MLNCKAFRLCVAFGPLLLFVSVLTGQTIKVFPSTYVQFPGTIPGTWTQIGGNISFLVCQASQPPSIDSCYNQTLSNAVDVYTPAGVDSRVGVLTQPLQQQIGTAQANIKTLSDANDALTKRLNVLESKPNDQAQLIAALQQQIIEAQANLKALSDANDALTKRIANIEAKVGTHNQPRQRKWWQ